MIPHPIRFQPVFKQTIWGGRRLADQLGKPIGPESDYAESWEVVDHGDDQSIVKDGSLAGLTLAQVMTQHRNWFLGQADSIESFPLLLKYLDCNRVLSVQVHPCDEFGLQMEKPDLGKTEAWYIVAADQGSLIYAGLKPGIDRQTFKQAIDAGQTEEVLHSFHPTAGDVVFIPAGTVHALGAGLLVAEIQQSSDTTFRLFDWNRVDAAGNTRPLHLQQGLEVTDYQSGPVTPRRSDPAAIGWQTVVRCDKFVLQLMERGHASISGDGKFHIVTVPRGAATLRSDQGVTQMEAGSTVVLPAAMGSCDVSVANDSTVFEAHLPD
jgi:mannose-6-phosphate isomerase